MLKHTLRRYKMLKGMKNDRGVILCHFLCKCNLINQIIPFIAATM